MAKPRMPGNDSVRFIVAVADFSEDDEAYSYENAWTHNKIPSSLTDIPSGNKVFNPAFTSCGSVSARSISIFWAATHN